jgi:hypothetical protein
LQDQAQSYCRGMTGIAGRRRADGQCVCKIFDCKLLTMTLGRSSVAVIDEYRAQAHAHAACMSQLAEPYEFSLPITCRTSVHGRTSRRQAAER